MSNSPQTQTDHLRGGVSPSTAHLSKELLELSEFIKDTSNSLVDRLESYEDIMSIEIGDTPLTRMRNVERET